MPARTKKARLLGLAFGAAALPGLVLATAGSAVAAPPAGGAQPKALGLARGATFDFSVQAFDSYFGGTDATDVIDGQTWTVGSRKYALQGGADELSVPAGRSTKVTVTSNATAGESTSTGLLLLYDNARTRDAQAVRVS